MKERPILFSGPMVRAILEGRKAQTRRVVKPQPIGDVRPATFAAGEGDPVWLHDVQLGESMGDLTYGDGRTEPLQVTTCKVLTCPYGKPGDLLWVRETWQGFFCGTDSVIPSSRIESVNGMSVAYKADDQSGCTTWRPSIHMPRWASRITLEVTEVRVERLQDISEEDAIAEGIKVQTGLLGESVYWDYLNNESRSPRLFSATDSYYTLWDSINGKTHPWESNPFVWVVSFRRLEASK
jgi:hypothetical protein